MKSFRIIATLALAGSLIFLGLSGEAADSPSKPLWKDTGSPQGIYFHWYEPTFYTGFAPRSQDPERIHIRLGRGNQVRLTIVLGDPQIDVYADDLLLRRTTIETLIAKGIITLTQNKEFEAFCQALDDHNVTDLVKRKGSISGENYRAESLKLMATLNPGRLFHIRFPLDEILKHWRKKILESAESPSSPQKTLDLINAILPGRINAVTFEAEMQTLVDRALEAARNNPSVETSSGDFRTALTTILGHVAGDRYPIVDSAIDVWEFTAIYPAGTSQAWVTWQGKKLPDFTVTGVWSLIPRMKGKGQLGMVDYISSNPGYGFIPMLPYQYAGGIAYNAIHNPGIRCPLPNSKILPESWTRAMGIRDPSKPYNNLWIVSRGPVSHGCTRLAAGHMSELRHVLPSSSTVLEKVLTFRNLPQCYDVFDIDGNGDPEVMGVKYFLAYAHTEDRIPYKVYAENSREPFYQWLYNGEIRFDHKGNAAFATVIDSKFKKRTALEGDTYQNILLYEADYEPDRIQFYKIQPISFESPAGSDFIRELGRTGHGYVLNRTTLRLIKNNS